ncbi:MAG: hypothetical protein C5B52_03255 [Bacteroidetes bacterium]|nr:MAG: hypothetical protein C5B52_03255 [Bacteroidota bacterium]
MKIAINIPTYVTGSLDSGKAFNIELIKKIALSEPSNEFIITQSGDIEKMQNMPGNISIINLDSPGKNFLKWRLTYDYKIPSILKKNGVDLFIATDGICSLRTKIPQILFVQDLSYLIFPELFPSGIAAFFKRNTAGFLKKAVQIVVPSQFIENQIIAKYKSDPAKIHIAEQSPGVEFRQLSWEEKESTREKYSEGKEFFLFVGTIHPKNNLKQLLQAFSLFKKRQKTNTQLLIVGERGRLHEEFISSFAHYKFKNEVKIIEDLPAVDLPLLMGTANAFVYPSLYDGFPVSILNAMKAGVPVLASARSAIPETAGEGAILFDPENVNELSAQMMNIYKNENLRNEMVNRGLERAKDFNIAKIAEKIRKLIHTFKQN